MDFISNSAIQQAEMLAFLEIASIDELFTSIPEILRLASPTQEDGLAEVEGMRLMEEIASKNTFKQYDSYLGGGAYDHYVPALVGAICAKSQFLTSYTPYQPEASQGMLQAIFEYQSVICALTGMEVSNASLYDGASACAEAVLMALRINKPRTKILIAGSLHPSYRAVILQYAGQAASDIIEIPFLEDTSIHMAALEAALDENTAAVLVQSPNVFGRIENTKEIFSLAKSRGSLAILCANPLAYGLFYSAGEAGADIAVGDSQPFGLPLNFGGPYVGYIACKMDYVRQLPGRIVGETEDLQGKRGFVLTLQAREQHIRREKATSNVCTNQALAALASLVAIAWYGKVGVPALALTNYQRATYLRHQLQEISQLTVIGNDYHFNEFVVCLKGSYEHARSYFLKHQIVPGHPLDQWYPTHFQNALLVCVTEQKTKQQLDHFVEALLNYENSL